MFKRSVLFSGLALVLTSVAAHAQTATAAVSITVAPVLAISSSGSFTFPTADDSHYTAGEVVSTGGPTLSHRGNVPYDITVEAQTGSAFGFTPDASQPMEADPNKPVSDLTIDADFGGTAASAAVGGAGSPNAFFSRAARGGNVSDELTARMALSYDNDPPGVYTTTVVFTIIAN